MEKKDGLPIEMGVFELFTMTSAASTMDTAFRRPRGGVSVTEVVACAGAENILCDQLGPH
jgi:hypothetical protein